MLVILVLHDTYLFGYVLLNVSDWHTKPTNSSNFHYSKPFNLCTNLMSCLHHAHINVLCPNVKCCIFDDVIRLGYLNQHSV